MGETLKKSTVHWAAMAAVGHRDGEKRSCRYSAEHILSHMQRAAWRPYLNCTVYAIPSLSVQSLLLA